MVSFKDESYWEAELKRILDDQKPEDDHLDYKGVESLLPPGRGGGGLDRQKRAADISKDVSSFLNSDGGVLVYGVPESEDPGRTGGSPLPVGPEIGFERGTVTKETIEDLITSNIQPRPGPDLFQVVEVPYRGRIVFVVDVRVGLGDVWQAKDKKYYKRFKYKAEPMDHYEVDMVRNRAAEPNLELTFGLNDRWEASLSNVEYLARQGEEVEIHLGIQNTRNTMAESALIELGLFLAKDSDALHKMWQGEIPPGLMPNQFRLGGIRKISWSKAGSPLPSNGYPVVWGQLSWNGANQSLAARYSPLFKTETPFPVAVLDMNKVFIQNGIPDSHAVCFWRIQAPNMKATEGVMELLSGSGSSRLTSQYTPPYIVTHESQWEVI